MSLPLHSINSPATVASAQVPETSTTASVEATALSCTPETNRTDDAAKTLFELANTQVAEANHRTTAAAAPTAPTKKTASTSDAGYDSDTTLYQSSTENAIEVEEIDDCMMTQGTADKSASAGAMKPPANRHKANGAPGKKQPLKRVRSDDCISSVAVEKRVKTTTPQPTALPRPSRRMPTFQGGPTPALNISSDIGEDSFMNFNSTVYEIRLGDTGFKSHGHESVLLKSPKFVQEIAKAKAKPRKAHQQTLAIDPHDPGAFDQMLQYLYKDKFNMLKHTAVLARLKEFHELMSLAKHFQLPGLQKQVVANFSRSRLLSRVDVPVFFDWAEDMYYEELDHESGPFKKYFERVAPGLLQKGKEQAETEEGDDGLMDAVLEMVKLGGGYAMELFKAAHTAISLSGVAVVKQESSARASGVSSAATVTPAVKTQEGGDDEDESLFVPSG